MGTHDSNIIYVQTSSKNLPVSKSELMTTLNQAGAKKVLISIKNMKRGETLTLNDIRNLLVKNLEEKTSISTISALVKIGELFGLDLFLPDILLYKQKT